jgi:ABC-type lipoprotein export system ATPase subunit
MQSLSAALQGYNHHSSSNYDRLFKCYSPGQLSGSEIQLMAIAQAFVNNPEAILAHEPSGNLGSENSAWITDFVKSLHN